MGENFHFKKLLFRNTICDGHGNKVDIEKNEKE